MSEIIANLMVAKVIGRASECMRRLLEAGLSYEALQMPIDDPEMRGRLVRFWMSGGFTLAAADVFHIVVNHAESLAQMITVGNYDWGVNSSISEKNFPVKGKGQVELNVELVHYGKSMNSDNIVQNMASRGLRPATLSELLAFGAAYPDKQRESPIVAFGSVWLRWSGREYVACLCGSDSGRGLDLCVWYGVWDGHFRFLAVRK
ncbi:MAG: hypothetical protein Q8N90_03525 [bacterium]|nr:hypothetical protein [bacterium]